MKLDIPPITKDVDLGDYAEELRGVCVSVWVNCPRSFRESYWTLLREAQDAVNAAKSGGNGTSVEAIGQAGNRISQWVAELWSKGGNTWTAEDISALANSDTDPALYPWLLNRSWQLVNEHRDRSKKK